MSAVNTAPKVSDETIRRAAFASAIGSAVEYYDFAIYSAAAALVFNKLFFPEFNDAVGVLAAFATYAVGFLVRPLGGLYFGSRGDRFGRRGVLMATVLLMGGASTAIGLLPTYESIGILAPILLVVLRMVQGFGAGAEQSSATTLMSEMAADNRRGYLSAIPFVGIWCGLLFATGSFALIGLADDEAIQGGLWRIPFLVSIVLLFVGVYIRRHLPETPEFEALEKTAKTSGRPISELLATERRGLLVGFGVRIGEAGPSNLFSSFSLSYLAMTVGVAAYVGPLAISVASACAIVTLLISAKLADRFGRRPVLFATSLFQVAWAFPCFALMQTGNTVIIILAVSLAVSCGVAGMQGAQCAYLTELFDARHRMAGVGIAREFSVVLVGGTAPFVASGLLILFDNHWWPVALYIVFLSLVTFVAAYFGPETARQPLRNAAAPVMAGEDTIA
ncbi:MFS transporter [Demetria terragena]|uniref:MFS transporter n=1 Tax=Demetria terragena TaxID=63959 RepID=UPI00037D782D|nr:MFS transporter [Demetria terragena]